MARAKKLADYIVKGQDSQDALLPTSVFLASDKAIPFDESKNTIEINIGSVGPFSVVDGQHRLEGLKMAAERAERVLDFEVVVLAHLGHASYNHHHSWLPLGFNRPQMKWKH